MTHFSRLLPLSLTLLLAGCAAAPSRFLIETAPATAPIALRVSSIELRDVVLPAYAEDSQILQETADGGMRPIKGAEWADGTARGVTAELARSLDLRGSASVAAEPWPLTDPAQVRLEVRIDRMVARVDGSFLLSGQFAVAAPERQLRDSLERFAISVPLADNGPGAVAGAYAAALEQLSLQILRRLARR